MSEEPTRQPGETDGSFVQSDAGVYLPTEGDHPSADETFEDVRDREQLGRPRTEMLQQVEDISPPAANPSASQVESGGVGTDSAEA